MDNPTHRTDPDDQPAGATETATCAVCDGPIEYTIRPDRHQPGWRHLTREPGPVHTAHPGPVTPLIVSETTGLDHGADAAPDGGGLRNWLAAVIGTAVLLAAGIAYFVAAVTR